MLDPGAAARTVEPVRILDRVRIDRRTVVDGGFLDTLHHDRSLRRMQREQDSVPAMTTQRDQPHVLEGGLYGLGDRLGFVAGLILAVSAFTGWYTGPGEGVTVSVLGWHTGTLGKLVFLIGLGVVLLVALREIGVAMPAVLPESLLTIALGALATIFVLVRVISIPDDFFFAGRGVGIWIALVSAVCVIAAGLLQASEEL